MINPSLLWLRESDRLGDDDEIPVIKLGKKKLPQVKKEIFSPPFKRLGHFLGVE